jgi:hypothetical protein
MVGHVRSSTLQQDPVFLAGARASRSKYYAHSLEFGDTKLNFLPGGGCQPADSAARVGRHCKRLHLHFGRRTRCAAQFAASGPRRPADRHLLWRHRHRRRHRHRGIGFAGALCPGQRRWRRSCVATGLGRARRHNLPSHAWSAGISAFTTVFALGQIIGPSVIGWIADGPGGLQQGLMDSALALFIGAVLASRQPPLAQALISQR